MLQLDNVGDILQSVPAVAAAVSARPQRQLKQVTLFYDTPAAAGSTSVGLNGNVQVRVQTVLAGQTRTVIQGGFHSIAHTVAELMCATAQGPLSGSGRVRPATTSGPPCWKVQPAHLHDGIAHFSGMLTAHAHHTAAPAPRDPW